jgi:hypothetical protein
MDAELAALASSGATALVGLMVSDSWTQVKEGFARLFARPAGEIPPEELETARIELLTAHLESDHAKQAAIQDRWRTRLQELLRSDATARFELRHLLDTLTDRSANSISNFNSGDVRFGSVIQAGRISGAAFNTVPTPSERDEPE